MAETKKYALAAFDAFVQTWGVKYDKAVECLIKDRDAPLVFYDFPAEPPLREVHRRRNREVGQGDSDSSGQHQGGMNNQACSFWHLAMKLFFAPASGFVFSDCFAFTPGLALPPSRSRTRGVY